MKEILNLLRRTVLFSGIDETEITSLLGCLNAKTLQYKKGTYLLRTGDSPESIGLLISGSSFIVQDDYWGNRNIRARITPGQVFAETFACIPGSVMDVSVLCEEDCNILWLNVQHILHTCPSTCSHHSRMIRNLLSDLAANSLRANEKLTHISRRSIREKLLSYLSSEANRQGNIEFEIPFNRQQLADYLSVERSALSAEISKMQKEGLLTVNRNRFYLK